MKDHEAEERLDDARQHLAEASQHIAHAVEQLALQEHLDGTAGREGQRSERLHRRRDGLAVTYQRLQRIQDELQTLQGEEAVPTSRWRQ